MKPGLSITLLFRLALHILAVRAFVGLDVLEVPFLLLTA